MHGGRKLERAFDDGFVGAGPHHVARGALAEQQRERIHDHRLAGAGLAGQDVEAGLERQRDVGNDGEIADAKLRKHYLRVRSLKSPQCSFFRSRLKKLSGPSRMRRMGRSARRTSRRSPG